ncbi:family 43 glycosylhydrolase [Pseudactinotalea suaedae]|uniref:family 43 glycosylhydrolase n=1 Tax=Pseudactinotalea suaedae TaxID=1524924 RepID=UPI0012E300E4|nr:family 43 glycosylhydrolase [Pseudactinotalea suaedae]
MSNSARSPFRRAALAATALGLALGGLTASPAAASGSSDPAVDPDDDRAVEAASVTSTPVPDPATITNPVSSPFADSYADPAVLRGKDGWWYAYATSDPLVTGGEFGLMHMARTQDFAEWEYLGTVFDEDTRPAWAAEGSFFWAPDVRYIDGEYRLYYTVTDSAAKPGGDPGIGMATAPTPAGPWTDVGHPVLESRAIPDSGEPPAYQGLIDPSVFVDDDGSIYLYVGGFSGGPHVTLLDETGHHAVGDLQQVAVSDRYEGSYVLRKGDHYYLMLSAAGCCSAVASGYSVFVGRSESPYGPFLDAEGVPLADSAAGGTQVVAANGSRWVGVGHHAVITDTTGQDWMVYHGIDRENGWLNEPGGINRRPMLVDRLDWIDGWPVVNAGAGPSEGPVPGPTLGSAMGIVSDDPASGRALVRLTGSFTSSTDTTTDAGDVAVLQPGRHLPGVVTARELVRGENRFETDVRLRPGAELCVRVDGLARHTAVCVDDADRTLSVRTTHKRSTVTDVATIPDRIDLGQWHTLVVTLSNGAVRAELQESGLGDPVAVAETTVRTTSRTGGTGAVQGLLSLLSRGGAAELDNLTIAPLAQAPERVPDPVVGDVTWSESFDGDLDDVLASGWTLLQEHPGLHTADGALQWPLTSGDLAGGEGGPALLREAPEGDWVIETDLVLDLGTDTVRNFQQAGLVVYADGEAFVRLSSVALGASRVVEFFTKRDGGGVVVQGGHLDGPPATEMTLRILRTHNDAGEQLYRSAFSIDGGETWRWGMTWTMPAGTEVQIGLHAGGGAEPATVAQFEEFRILES